MTPDHKLRLWGTWLGAAALIFVPLSYVDGINRFVLLPQAISLLVITTAGLLAWLVLDRRAFPSSTAFALAAAFFGVEVLSGLVSDRLELTLLPLSVEAGFTLFFLFLLVSRPSDTTLLRAGGIGCVVVSTIGLVQAMGGFVDLPSAALPSATLGHRNLAAAYVVSLLPFVAFGAWKTSGRFRHAWWAGLGLSAGFLVATRSRGAWVAVGLVCLVWVFFRVLARRPFTLRGRWAGVIVAVVFFASSLWVPVPTSRDKGLEMWQGKVSVVDAAASVLDAGGDKGRLRLWKRTLEMIQSRPIIGIGPGHWRVAFPAFAEGDLIDAQAAPIRPHNDLLWIWAESGSAGLLLFIALLAVLGRAGWRALREGNGVVIAAVCAGIAALANGLFSFPRAFPGAWLPFWVAAAIIARHEDGFDVRRRAFVPLLVVGLLLSGGATAYLARGIAFDRHHLRARIAEAQSDWATVEREAGLAISFGGYSEAPYALRARAREASRRYRGAEADFKKALAWAPSDVTLWIGLGNVLRQLRNVDGARNAYMKAHAIDPYDGRSHNNLGSLHAVSGRMDSARVWFERAIQGKSSPVEAYANLSAVYRRDGALKQARATAEQGLTKDKRHVGLLNALGSAAAAEGDEGLAVAAFSEALKIDSTLVQAHFNLARLYESQGKTEEAAAAYRSVILHFKDESNPRVAFVRDRLEALER